MPPPSPRPPANRASRPAKRGSPRAGSGNRVLAAGSRNRAGSGNSATARSGKRTKAGSGSHTKPESAGTGRGKVAGARGAKAKAESAPRSARTRAESPLRPAGQSPHDAYMRDVLLQFRIVVRAIRRHYRRVEIACGISGAQLWALAQVDGSPGLKVGELASELAIHQSTASNMLDKLESGGLMERRRSDPDRRVVRLFVTTRGKRVLARAPRPLRGVLQQGLTDLPTPALAALRRQLGALVRHMQVRDADAMGTLLEHVIERSDGD